MANDRLRDALLRNGLTTDTIAAQLGVDRKTVERWVTTGRIPYRRHRHEVAAMVRESDVYLWPGAIPQHRRADVGRSEVVELYPRRSDSPAELWARLINDVNGELDVLAYAGLFLPEQYPHLVRLLRKKSRAGLKARLLFGDPDSGAVARRSNEENIADAIPHKIRNVLHHYQPLAEDGGAEVRLHETTLYNSVYRFDDEMLVSLHVLGKPAAHAPLLHLRKLAEGDLFTTYADSFEQVWSGAIAAWR